MGGIIGNIGGGGGAGYETFTDFALDGFGTFSDSYVVPAGKVARIWAESGALAGTTSGGTVKVTVLTSPLASQVTIFSHSTGGPYYFPDFTLLNNLDGTEADVQHFPEGTIIEFKIVSGHASGYIRGKVAIR